MGNKEEEACKLGLGVGEKYYAATQTKDDHDHDQDHGKKIKQPMVCLRLDLCRFEVFPKDDPDHTDHRSILFEGHSSLKPKNNHNIIHDDDQENHVGNRGSTRNENNITNGGISRKKLKLTKEQTMFLEGCFKSNTTLNPAQKRALAEQLNLKPRQVEVWFQNRRARTKMKQTEEDCELLKKCCESLGQENKRLRKELQELRSIRVEQCHGKLDDIQFANNVKLTMCPNCQKLSKN